MNLKFFTRKVSDTGNEKSRNGNLLETYSEEAVVSQLQQLKNYSKSACAEILNFLAREDVQLPA